MPTTYTTPKKDRFNLGLEVLRTRIRPGVAVPVRWIAAYCDVTPECIHIIVSRAVRKATRVAEKKL
jgi:hypothetical protein